MARAALEQLGLEQLLFIPTGTQSYRPAPVASAEHRVAMLRLALQGEPRYAIDKRELAAGASGHTVDTLKLFDRPWLLMGADQYAKLDSWHRPDEVRRLARIAVFQRPGSAVDRKAKVLTLPPTEISASDLRARAARGEDLSAFVPAAVADYIKREGLYR
jgi:nicotinate-nucleotide adenylyltransferase